MSRSSTADRLVREMNKRLRLLDVARTGDFALFKQLAEECENRRGLAMALLSVKDSEDRTVLHMAAAGGKTDTCDYLVNRIKLDVNMRDGNGCTPLLHAVAAQKISTIEFLIAFGADVSLCDSNGCSSLHMAADTGNVEIMELLISNGAEVNSMEGPATPLQMVVSEGNKEAVEVLLRHNADPNLTGGQLFTPVFSALMAESVECLELLLKAGGDPNTTEGGMESLVYAADTEQERMVECLVKYGADPNVTCSFGLTPLEFAALTNNLDIMRILLPATAPIPSYPDWSIHGILEHIPSVVPVATEASAGSTCIMVLNPDLPKAHYRKGGAYKLLKNYKKATEAFKKALQLDPNNKEIERELMELEKMVSEE